VREETGTLVVCLSERFTRPGAYEVDVGTPIRTLVEEVGGGLRDGGRLRALQVGGPLGGFIGPDDLDAPLSATGLAERGAAVGHGSLVAVDDRLSARDLLRHLWDFAAEESCGMCTPCRVGTRRGLRLAEEGRIDGSLLDLMETASLCAFGTGIAHATRNLYAAFGEPPP
jgi:formate dehydrogenase iron-sulfur subunit